MKRESDLQDLLLRRLDGRGYKAYKEIKGQYDLGTFQLLIDHVQGDPFAAPSRMRVRVDQQRAGFPPDTFAGRSREVGLRDFLTRSFFEAAQRICRGGGDRGTGKSGLIAIDRPGQEILERTSMLVDERCVEARFVVGLPAFGRRIAGRHAQQMLLDELPRIVEAALLFSSYDQDQQQLYRHVEISEDADYLRARLDELDLVAFVAEGASLPRASGIDPRPLRVGEVVPLSAPETLRTTVQLPNSGSVTGMGVPRGVTLIVGGGYHGKSTLLRAIELGVYNHVPGDGRELVVTDPAAIKIRAEDGRRVEKVEIHPFIADLPLGRDTRAFCTEDASGSTSQAANILEAVEVGARVLLIDEDTSATNFMIRDHRMQQLVAKEKEPITPFVDKVQQLYRDRGVSTVLVMGGSGDYLDVADRVICMEDYTPRDVTLRARAVAQKHASLRRPEGGERFGDVAGRIPLVGGFDARRGKRPVKIAAKGLRAIEFGRQTIDLIGLEQLVDRSQTSAIGDALHHAVRHMDGQRTVREVVELVMQEIEERSLDLLSPYPRGDYAAFRTLELAAAMNRLRSLEVKQRR